MSKSMVVHVRCKCLYKVIKLGAVWRTQSKTANISYFHLELNAVNVYLACTFQGPLDY